MVLAPFWGWLLLFYRDSFGRVFTCEQMAPVTGDIIAYKEAPEDFERAYELMKKGYKEN